MQFQRVLALLLCVFLVLIGVKLAFFTPELPVVTFFVGLFSILCGGSFGLLFWDEFWNEFRGDGK